MDKEELLRKQREAKKKRDDALSELKGFKQRGERLPQELKDRAEQANQEIIELGTKIQRLEDEEATARNDDNEFWGRMQEGAGQITETLSTRDTNDLEDPHREDATINRESLAVLNEVIRQVAGSRMELPPRIIDADSERLVREMISTDPDLRSAHEGDWAQRRQAIAERTGRFFGEDQPVARANVIGANTGTSTGGVLVPDDNSFMSQVQLARQAYGGVKRVAREFVTADGSPLPIPTSYSATTEGEKATENINVNDFDLVFGEEVMNSYMATSGRLGMSFQLLRDAAPNMPMLLGLVAGQRIERKEADWFINGTGAAGLIAGEPQGLDAAFQVPGFTFYYDIGEKKYVDASGADGSVAGNVLDPERNGNIINVFRDIKYSVDPAYRSSMNYSFVMSDLIDRMFAGAQDSRGNLVRGFDKWLFGNTAKGMGISFGGLNVLSDYSITQTQATGAGNVRHAWVGDFNWFWIRRVRGMYMIRDPYTDSRKMLTHWIFGRACDAQGLFRTEAAGQKAAIKCVVIDAHA